MVENSEGGIIYDGLFGTSNPNSEKIDNSTDSETPVG